MSSFKRRFWTLLSGNVIGQAITVAISPLLTRLYSPESFGKFGIYLSIVAILGVLGTMRFERGIVVARSAREQRSLLALIVIIAASVGGSVALLSLVIPWDGGQTDNAYIGVLQNWGWIIGLAVTLTGLEIAFRHLALKRDIVGVMAASRVGHSCVQGGSQAALGAGGWSSGLALGAIFSLTFRVSWLAGALSRDLRLTYRRSLRDILGALRRNKEFPKYMILASLCTALIGQSLMVMGGALASAAIVGQLYLAHRMMVLPMGLLTRSITDVNFKELSELDVSLVRRLYLSRVRRLILWGTPPFIAAFLLSPFAYTLIFGDEWQSAGRFAQLLVPGLWVQFAISPFGPTFWVLKLNRLFLGLSIVRLVLLFSGMGSGFIAFDVEGIAAGFSVGVILGYTLQHMLLLRVLK